MTRFDKNRFKSAITRARLQYYFPALIAALAVVLSIIYADQQKREIYREGLRAAVAESLGLVQTKLEGNLNADILLAQGMTAVVSAEPNMTQDRFATLANRLLESPSQLRSLAAAPDMIVRYIYPYEANRGVIGLDYMTNPEQRAGVIQARDTGQRVVTGPVKLVQGGEAVLVRYPVVEQGPGRRTFWGILTAVIDLERLYRDSGLNDTNLPIVISIAKADQQGQSQNFFGDAARTADEPVQQRIELGTEAWVMSAVPKAGWNQPIPGLIAFRLQMLAVAAMIIIPVLSVARLLRERQDNIAVLRQREEELRAVSHRLEIALHASKIGVWELDVASGELIWDTRMKALYGLDPNMHVTRSDAWSGALHPDDKELAERELTHSIRNGTDYSATFRICCPSGEVRHMRAFGTVYRDTRFRKRIVGVNWNVTADIKLQQALQEAKSEAEKHNRELEEAHRRMEHASLHDALTGLPNRRYLDQHLNELRELTGRPAALTLLHIDLDRFKDINDTLGHAAGDAILRHAAAKLRESTRKGDFAARIGGDEFVVICKEMTDEHTAGELARRLIDALNTPIEFGDQECRVGASIGIATRNGSDEPTEQLLVNADIALYEAKRHGRNRLEHYTDKLKSAAVNAKRTADEILRSVEQNDFIAYFQPQFDARTLEICGAEALARWRHPEKGLLSPDSFLKIAESLSVVSQIDESILEQALFQKARWAANGLDIPRVSVNISAQRLFDDSLERRLSGLQIAPGTLSFELLESISFDDTGEAVMAGIGRIKKCGIDIEIDDFGTGYASILSLLKLSPRRLKIDRQLTMPILKSEPERRLISSIVDIGRSLGIEIVAEGVETMEHARILRDLGCHTLQGYALAQPMAPERFIEFAKSRSWLAEDRRVAV